MCFHGGGQVLIIPCGFQQLLVTCRIVLKRGGDGGGGNNCRPTSQAQASSPIMHTLNYNYHWYTANFKGGFQRMGGGEMRKVPPPGFKGWDVAAL